MKALVVVGFSAGGVESFRRLTGLLRPGHPPVVVVQHNFPDFDRWQIERARTGAPSATTGWIYLLGETVLTPGLIYQVSALHRTAFSRAAGGRPMVLLQPAAEGQPFHPWIDQVMTDAAEALTRDVIGIVMSGLLNDGAAGLAAIRAAGGWVMVEPPRSAAFASMPAAALARLGGWGEYTCEEMARVINGTTPVPPAVKQEN